MPARPMMARNYSGHSQSFSNQLRDTCAEKQPNSNANWGRGGNVLVASSAVSSRFLAKTETRQTL